MEEATLHLIVFTATAKANSECTRNIVDKRIKVALVSKVLIPDIEYRHASSHKTVLPSVIPPRCLNRVISSAFVFQPYS